MAKVIVFRGKAGVGKSAISAMLGKKLNMPVFAKDDIYDSIAGYVDDHEMWNKACYDTLYKIIETNISNGIDVIVDAGFHHLSEAVQFKNWVLSKNAIFIPLLCVCSNEELWAERFNRRSINPKPNNMITDFNELKSHYKDLKTEPLENEIILDAVSHIDELMERAIAEIKKGEYRWTE